MQLKSLGPIRATGWAFRLSADFRVFSRVAFFAFVLLLQVMQANPAGAQHGTAGHEVVHEASSSQHHSALVIGGWEGSAAGIAYSEFNHHVAGLLLLLIGCAELNQALRSSAPLWARLLLPGALGVMGMFLLIWSDHEAWPIGSMSLSQTLFGGDHEILQHKLYGILALVSASIEILRRSGRVKHAGWMVPLPAFAILGGWMLFGHSHGAHPSADKIALHHAIMGSLAITAGSSRLVSAWKTRGMMPARSRWELLWAGFLILIALQLIFYFE